MKCRFQLRDLLPNDRALGRNLGHGQFLDTFRIEDYPTTCARGWLLNCPSDETVLLRTVNRVSGSGAGLRQRR